MEKSINLDEIRSLYYKSQFKECLNKVNEFNNINTDFYKFQVTQLFKSLSYFELGKFKDGTEIIEQLIEESSVKKKEKVEDIDLIIRIQYQQHLYNLDKFGAEKNNQYLDDICQRFRKQNDPLTQQNYGLYLFGLGMHQFIENYRDDNNLSCIEILNKSLKLVDQYQQEIMGFIIWVYEDKNLINESIIWAEKLYQMNPMFPGSANNLAQLYQKTKEFDKALELFQKAEEIGLNNLILYLNIALFYKDLGNSKKTIEYYQKALNINPQCHKTSFLYGKYLYKNGQKPEGLQLINQAILYNPEYCDPYNFLEKQSYKENNITKSIEYIQKCIDVNPESGYYLLKMGLRLHEQNQFEKAIEYFVNANKQKMFIGPQLDSNSYLADCYHKLGRYEDSLKQYIKTININIADQEIQFEINQVQKILDEEINISHETKINIIESIHGPFQQKLNSIIIGVENKNMKQYLLKFQEFYRQILLLIAYSQQIQPFLKYQNSISHWDLFIN